MKKTKQIFSVLLAVVMLLCAVPVMQVSATQTRSYNFNSASYSSDPGQYMVNIAEAQLGRTGSSLGYTEQWCADFVADCAVIAGQSTAIPANGRVDYFGAGIITAGGKQVSAANAKPGDICIIDWADVSGYNNHVEIVYKVVNSSVYTIGGNTGVSNANLYTRKVARHSPLASSNIYKIIRPNYKKAEQTYSAPPTAPIVSVDKRIGLVNEDITIYFNSERASNFWIGIYSDNVLWTQDVVYDNYYTINYAYVGKYDIVVVARNNCGSADGYASFRLGKEGDYKPSNFSVSCNKTVALKNNDITFTFSAEFATGYWLGISKDGNWIKRENVYDNSFTVQLSQTGKYQAAIVATNPCSSSETKYIDFTVVDSAEPPTVPQVTVNKQVALVDENVAISFSSSGANNYWIGIYKDDILFNDSVVYGNTFSISYPWVGQYDVVVVARNDSGSSTGYASFKVGKKGDYKPSNFVVSSDKSVALRNEQVTFSFSADNANNYWIGVYNTAGYLFEEKVLSEKSFTTTCQYQGNYSIAIVAMNDCTSSETKYIKLQIADKKAFSVKYDANGGYAAPEEQSKVYNKGLVLSSQKPIKEGFIFMGWNTKNDGSGINYTSGGTYSYNGDMTMYAMWNKCNHVWSESSIVAEATCSNEGEKEFYCLKCLAAKTETIAKLAHTTTLINAKDATYTAEGYTGDTYCTVCKQTLTKGDVIPKLTKPDEPTNPTNPTSPTNPANPTQPQPSGSCRYCGGTHTGFPGVLIGFFHSILALFGLRK